MCKTISCLVSSCISKAKLPLLYGMGEGEDPFKSCLTPVEFKSYHLTHENSAGIITASQNRN